MFHSAHIPESPLCASQRGGRTTLSTNMGRKPQVQASLFSVKWNWSLRGAGMVQNSPCREEEGKHKIKRTAQQFWLPNQEQDTRKVCNSILWCSAPRKNHPEDKRFDRPSGVGSAGATGEVGGSYNSAQSGEAGLEASGTPSRTTRENRDGVSERSKSKYRGTKWMKKLSRGCLIPLILKSWIWNNSRHC